MKSLLLFFVFTISTAFSSNEEIKKSFTEFYHHEKIVFNKCGLNTKHFLTYLKNQNIELKNGYVVSLHEDMGLLNHFRPRWGRQDTYENGVRYNRSNWYFHVFAVIDGYVFDFSHESTKAIPLRDYLIESYLPKYKTNNIFLLGKVDRLKMLKKFLTIKMKVYPLKKYEKNLGPSFYEGRFIELFNYVDIDAPSIELGRNIENIPPYKKNAYGSFKRGEAYNYSESQFVYTNNSVNIYDSISFNLGGESFPVKTSGATLCQSLGHMGSATSYFKEIELTRRGQRLIELSCSLFPEHSSVSIGKDDVKCSFRYGENDQHYNRKVLKQVGCTSFEDFIIQHL